MDAVRNQTESDGVDASPLKIVGEEIAQQQPLLFQRASDAGWR